MPPHDGAPGNVAEAADSAAPGVTAPAAAGSSARTARGPASWARPGFGAQPIEPLGLPLFLRWALLAGFGVFVAAGQAGAPRWQIGLALGMVAFNAVFATTTLTRARRSADTLLRAWAVTLPIDLVVIAVATSVDSHHPSVIPTIGLATVFHAAAMFRGRDVIAIGVFAAAAPVIAYIPEYGSGALDVESLLQVFVALAVTGFAVVRGRAEEQLRYELVAAEARQHEQAEALREALEATRRSEERFQAFAEHAPAAMLIFDEQGVPTFANRAVREVLGLEVIGQQGVSALLDWWKSWRDPAADGPEAAAERSTGLPTWVEGNDWARIRRAIAVAIAGTPTTFELMVATENRGPLRAWCALFPVEAGAGAILLDVTAERLVAAQAVRAQQLATVGTLAGGIAHDFNNLLTALLGNLHLARGSMPAGSPAFEYIDDARVCAERGAELVDQLLTFSRPRVEAMAPLHVGTLLQETGRLAERTLTKSVELTVECPEADEMVRGNAGALEQVLLNLIVNARDAAQSRGRVRLSCRRTNFGGRRRATHPDARDGEFVVIDVADNGCGIPKAILGRIFDPFFTTKEVGKGSGLGLATAQSIIRAHGGWIDVESREGVGSTFSVVLPAAAIAVEPVGTR